MSKVKSPFDVHNLSASSPSDIPGQNGADADGRSFGKSTGRNYRFGTSIPETLHEEMKQEAIRLRLSINAIFEAAWKLWLGHNGDAKLYRELREVAKRKKMTVRGVYDEALKMWLAENR